MSTDESVEGRARALERQAAQLRATKRQATRLATIAHFVEKLPGWEKEIAAAVIAALRAGEENGHIELTCPQYPKTGAPLENVSAWISFHVSPTWLDSGEE